MVRIWFDLCCRGQPSLFASEGSNFLFLESNTLNCLRVCSFKVTNDSDLIILSLFEFMYYVYRFVILKMLSYGYKQTKSKT